MAQNIKQKITETLQSTSNDIEREDLRAKLIHFFKQYDLPFQFNEQQFSKLESLAKEEQSHQNKQNKTPVNNWNRWNIFKSRTKERLRTIKRFIPKKIIRYIRKIIMK